MLLPRRISAASKHGIVAKIASRWPLSSPTQERGMLATLRQLASSWTTSKLVDAAVQLSNALAKPHAEQRRHEPSPHRGRFETTCGGSGIVVRCHNSRRRHHPVEQRCRGCLPGMGRTLVSFLKLPRIHAIAECLQRPTFATQFCITWPADEIHLALR